jgi:hypothetical protein
MTEGNKTHDKQKQFKTTKLVLWKILKGILHTDQEDKYTYETM